MKRLLVLCTLLLGWATALTALSTPADAAPLCESVSTTGTVVGVHSVGRCQPYSDATLCRYQHAGLDPSAHVWIVACIPD